MQLDNKKRTNQNSPKKRSRSQINDEYISNGDYYGATKKTSNETVSASTTKRRKQSAVSSSGLMYSDGGDDHDGDSNNIKIKMEELTFRTYDKWARKLIIRERVKTIEERQILMQPGSRLLKMVTNAMQSSSSNRTSANQRDSEEKMKYVELIFKAMQRIADLGFLLTHEQSIIIKAMIRAQIPKILGEHMVVHLGTLMRKYKMTSFRKILAIRFGRRRGKSKAVGYFHAIMMATQPKFFGMIMNLDQDLAEQNLQYALGFIKMLETDPDHVINCKFETKGKNDMVVRSVHGSYTKLFAAPDISRLQGKVCKLYSVLIK